MTEHELTNAQRANRQTYEYLVQRCGQLLQENTTLREAVYIQTAQLTKLRIAYSILQDALYGESGRKDITTAMNAIQRQITRLERESGVEE